MVYKKELAERIEDLLQEANIDNFEVKRMFGGVGYLVSGNMACGVNKDNLIVRVGKNAYHFSLQIPGVREFDLTGRPMTGWVNVSSANLESETDLFAWVMRGVNYAKSLPAK